MTKTLEARPEKYSEKGASIKHTLLLLDEFAQYGRIDDITEILGTLRSKNVTCVIFCQSMADLDRIYGQATRRVIMDNLPYRAILGAIDPGSQKYFAESIGTIKMPQFNHSMSLDIYGYPAGYNRSITETREYIIPPHEFGFMGNSIVVQHPQGFSIVQKCIVIPRT
jgi:type IV secretory pathway TraG/TraD family ATPase VirD4